VIQVSQAFEKFLRGEDRLARLLCELPAYTPSAEAEFEAVFARAAQAAQTTAIATPPRAAATVTTSPSPAPETAARLEAIPSAFEPPASLEANFLKMAASIESAQAPRREAVLTGIAKGDSPQAMLGAALAPASEEWLRAQAVTAPATQAAPAATAVKKRAFLRFRCFDLRWAALAGLLAAISTQLVLTLTPDAQQVAVQDAFQTAMLAKDASKKAELGQNAEPALAEAQVALEQTPGAMRQGAQDKGKLAARERHAAPGSGMAQDARADARAAQPAPPAAARVAEQTSRPGKMAASGITNTPKEEGPAREGATGEIARQEAKQVERKMPAEQPVSTAAKQPRPPTLAAAPMTRQNSVDTGIIATLADDPADIAARLPARPAGAVWTVWAVYSRHIGQPELDRWLETLRQHIPESSRPARFELIRDDASGGPSHLRIVPPTLPAVR
jgi:hypothetical protein